MSTNRNRPTHYVLTLTRSKDEPRIRALAAALSEQAGGIHVGPVAAFRWALSHAERLLGLEGVGPGTATPVGGPNVEPSDTKSH